MFPMKSADGKSEIREIPIKKNTNVIISILSANRNKAVWGEDAEEWKPERWLGKSPDEVAKVRLPGVYSSMCASFCFIFFWCGNTYEYSDEKDDFSWGRKSLHVSLFSIFENADILIHNSSKWLQVLGARNEYVIHWHLGNASDLFSHSSQMSFTELVLSVLLESFIFSPGTKEIEWVMRGLATPIIKDSGDARRTMPMKLALVRDGDEA